MPQLVECVPNFSEGRNKEIIDAIATAISQTEGCMLLDIDSGTSTNRTVYSFVGSPNAVVEGALNAARAAFPLINMARHLGEHPRVGAMDVCPFIPLFNITMEECINCAKDFGEKLASELKVPVYLYAEAAARESRRFLSGIRTGEYEALPDKLQDPEWAPDFGPATFVPSWGATVTGTRKFLIAYNVNLLSTKEMAHRIALDIREQGRGKDKPGRLNKVQAIGWYLDEVNMAQISTNLLDFEVTPLHMVYEEVCRVAKDLNLPVVGSQLVGLVPLKALINTAEYYMAKDNLFILEEENKIRLVINRLGLDSITHFNPRERIIEYMVQHDASSGSLITYSLQSFVAHVGARSAAPGGGSVAAAVSAMGAALGSMVGQMTFGKRQFEDLDGVMRKLIPPFHHGMKELLDIVDEDSSAFSSYLTAMKLPRTTAEEKASREAAMQQGLKKAISVPLSLAQKVDTLWAPLLELVKYGNIACLSDLQVAAKVLEAGVFGAYFNVLINLKNVNDGDYKTKTNEEVTRLLEEAKRSSAAVLEAAEGRTQ